MRQPRLRRCSDALMRFGAPLAVPQWCRSFALRTHPRLAGRSGPRMDAAMMPQPGTAETLDLHGLPVTDQVAATGPQPLGDCRDLYHLKASDTVRVMP